MPADTPGQARRRDARKTTEPQPIAVIGRRVIQPGRTAAPINVPPEPLQQLLRRSLIIAAGLDPSKTTAPPPPVLWDDGTSRLLVHLSDAELRCGHGFVDVSLIVECDATQQARVVCTFVTTPPDRPGGFVWATQDRPRGPQPVVQVWGDSLVALCWRALIDVAVGAAGGAGVDPYGRRTIAATVVASPDGLMITPMAPHRFMQLTAQR